MPREWLRRPSCWATRLSIGLTECLVQGWREPRLAPLISLSVAVTRCLRSPASDVSDSRPNTSPTASADHDDASAPESVLLHVCASFFTSTDLLRKYLLIARSLAMKCRRIISIPEQFAGASGVSLFSLSDYTGGHSFSSAFIGLPGAENVSVLYESGALLRCGERRQNG